MNNNRGPQKVKNFKGTVKRIIELLSTYKVSVITSLIFSVIGAVLFVVGPKILGNATNVLADDYIQITIYNKITEEVPSEMLDNLTGEMLLSMMPEEVLANFSDNQKEVVRNMDLSQKPTVNYEKLTNILALLVTIYLLAALFEYGQSFIMSKSVSELIYNLRKDVAHKLNTVPVNYYDTKTSGEVLSVVTSDVDLVSNNLTNIITNSLKILVTIIGIIIMMLTINFTLTLVAILLLPVSAFAMGMVIKFSQKYFVLQQENTSNMNSFVDESYSGLDIINTFNYENKSNHDFNKLNDKLASTNFVSQFLSMLIMPIINLVSNIGFVAVCIIGGRLVIKGKMNIGDIQSFIQYIRNLSQQTSSLAQIMSGLQSTVASFERIFEFLDAEDEVLDKENLEPATINGEIEFKHVDFGYSKDTPIITDFNCKVAQGERVAIVGKTGAGKTTLMKLLMRFYEIDNGNIIVDGKEIHDIKVHELRDNIGMVLQDSYLFEGTIMENILYGSTGKSVEEVKKACKIAHIDHFIETLPDGYDSVLNEEQTNLSSGQKQLITIARAFLNDPKILILDEATSSVDTRLELLIQNAMENLMKSRTSFIIAHRLSTIKDADRILVLDKGNVVEQGNHESLLAQKGYYESLYNSQFEE